MYTIRENGKVIAATYDKEQVESWFREYILLDPDSDYRIFYVSDKWVSVG